MSSRSIPRFAASRLASQLACIAPLAVLCAAPALAADPIVFTSWGGTTQSSQQKDWAQPFTQASGIKVLMDGPTDYGKLKAMVESGNVSWDVVDVEGDFAYAAEKAGLIEPIDYSVVKKADLDPRFATPSAVGSFYYSFVLGYNKAKYTGAQPQNWVDLFDTKRFPGKRTLYKWSAPGVLEIALLADGVAPNKLYPLDLDRAFKKLDSIKGDIVWWSGGAQSQQLLASGEAPIGMFWNGRLHALAQTGVPVGMSWNQPLLNFEWVVLAGQGRA
nr:ABC transporter substrate-binding protein [Burkholderia multivorans]